MKRNYSILLGILLSIFLISKDFFLPVFAGKEFVSVNNKKYELIKNHSRDADVEFVLPAGDVFFEYFPVTLEGFNWPKPGKFGFNNSVVYIGIDKKGNILSFICPQVDNEIGNGLFKGTVRGEVEVGKVGGKMNPKNGEGVLLASDLQWKFWGDFEIDGKSISLDKKNAAFVPIYDRQNKNLLSMNNIPKTSHAGVNIDEIFSSYVIEAIQSDPRGLQKGLLQSSLIEFVNLRSPGLLNDKTKIKWNIDLKAPQPISGLKYKKMAEELHMSSPIHSH